MKETVVEYEAVEREVEVTRCDICGQQHDPSELTTILHVKGALDADTINQKLKPGVRDWHPDMLVDDPEYEPPHVCPECRNDPEAVRLPTSLALRRPWLRIHGPILDLEHSEQMAIGVIAAINAMAIMTFMVLPYVDDGLGEAAVIVFIVACVSIFAAVFEALALVLLATFANNLRGESA